MRLWTSTQHQGQQRPGWWGWWWREVKARESQQDTRSQCNWLTVVVSGRCSHEHTHTQKLILCHLFICDLIYVHCKIFSSYNQNISLRQSLKSFICSNMQSTLKFTEMFFDFFSMALTQQHIQTYAEKTSWIKNDIFRRQTPWHSKCRIYTCCLKSSVHQYLR